MKKTSDTLSERDYFKFFFVVLVIDVFHIGVSILYAPDFTSSLASFIGISMSFTLVAIAASIPIIIAVFYVYQSFKNYSNSILKMFGGMYDSAIILPYLNTIYLAMAAIEKTPTGTSILINKLEILGIYLVGSIIASYAIKKVSFILIYVYRAKSPGEEVEEIDLKEEKILLGENEYLLIDIYTRKGKEHEFQVLIGKEELWNVNKEEGEGRVKFVVKPMSSLSDWLKIVYKKAPLVEFEVETSKIQRKVKVILELLIPSQGSKNIRSYEIVKEEGARLSEFIKELSSLIDANIEVIKVMKKTRRGYFEIDPRNEVPASNTENRYLVEANLLKTRDEHIKIVKPVSHKESTNNLLLEIQDLLSKFDEMRDDLW